MSCVSFGNDESANYSSASGEWKAIQNKVFTNFNCIEIKPTVILFLPLFACYVFANTD